MKTMKRIWNGFKIAFAMYSKIPMPRADWEKENMRYMMCFFPFVGIVIGALMVGWSFLSGKLGAGDSLRSVIYVLIPVLVTGGIHLDGLLDTADALSSWQPREKKLEILKDSNAGAFAVIVACCYFLACFGFWTELSGRQVLVLSGGYVLSRSMSGLSVASFPCARKTGTVATFSDAVQERTVMTCLYILLFLSAGFMCLLDAKLGTAAVVGAWCTFFWYYCMSMKQFGGITGDLAGCFVQTCELVMAICVWAAGKF